MITESQMERRYNALSVNCKKVYDAVPISEPWSTSYILSEIQRKSSYTSNARVLTGSLNTLKASGLVREISPGLFVRVAIKPAASKTEDNTEITEEEKDQQMPQQKTAEKKEPASAIDLLAGIAKSLRTLAGDIETAALAIEEGQSKSTEEVQKLRQLQALLKGLA